MKKKIVTSFLLMGGCIGYIPSPTPLAKEAPPSTTLEYPSFPSLEDTPSQTQVQVESIYSGLTKYTEGQRLTDLEDKSIVCNTELSLSQLQGRFTQIEEIALLSTSIIQARYEETLQKTIKERPELAQFISLVNTQVPDRVEPAEIGLLWLVTEAVSNELCHRDKKEDFYSLSAALVHWSSSQEMIYRSFFEAYEPMLVDQSYDMYWNGQAAAKKVLVAQLGELYSVRPEGYINSSNIFASLQSYGLPLKCKTNVGLSNILSPGLISSGPNATTDAQFWVSVECENTASKRVLMSESLVQSGSIHPCMASPEGEFILPELDPKEKASFVLGPYLMTDCPTSVSHSYRIESSHYPSSASLKINFKLRDSSLLIEKPIVDQDMPGSSVIDSNSQLDKGDAIELLFNGSLDPNYHLLLTGIDPLPTNLPSPFHTISIDSSLFSSSGKKHTMNNDIDLSLLSGNDWDEMARLRRSGVNSNTSVFEFSTSDLWLKNAYTYYSACQSSSKYLPSPLDQLYGMICEEVSYQDFSRWLKLLYTETCETNALIQQVETETGSSTFSELVQSTVEGATPSPANQSTDKSNQQYINPNYSDVVNAIDELLTYGVIGKKDLATALAYTDSYFFEQSKSREIARQLLLAKQMTHAVLAQLGPEYLTEIPIYKQGSAVGILELENKILEIKIKQFLAAQSMVQSSTGLNLTLQEVVQALITEGKCSGPPPIPPAPPHEIRESHRYSTLPIIFKEKK